MANRAMSDTALEFGIALSAAEIEQVHELNHLAFVRELGQHADPGEARLVDKYHDKNTYLIARRGERVVAMLAVHDRPPFSTAARMDDPAWIARHCPRPLEVRLLTVRAEERRRRVLLGLLWTLYRFATGRGYSHLLISGVRQQRRLYARLGFVALGAERQSGRAWYAPMVLELAVASDALRRLAQRWERWAGRGRSADRVGVR
jgi:predicted N-acetyltransferase YhbS